MQVWTCMHTIRLYLPSSQRYRFRNGKCCHATGPGLSPMPCRHLFYVYCVRYLWHFTTFVCFAQGKLKNRPLHVWRMSPECAHLEASVPIVILLPTRLTRSLKNMQGFHADLGKNASIKPVCTPMVHLKQTRVLGRLRMFQFDCKGQSPIICFLGCVQTLLIYFRVCQQAIRVFQRPHILHLELQQLFFSLCVRNSNRSPQLKYLRIYSCSIMSHRME